MRDRPEGAQGLHQEAFAQVPRSSCQVCRARSRLMPTPSRCFRLGLIGDSYACRGSVGLARRYAARHGFDRSRGDAIRVRDVQARPAGGQRQWPVIIRSRWRRGRRIGAGIAFGRRLIGLWRGRDRRRRCGRLGLRRYWVGKWRRTRKRRRMTDRVTRIPARLLSLHGRRQEREQHYRRETYRSHCILPWNRQNFTALPLINPPSFRPRAANGPLAAVRIAGKLS
jgi:hypothetical protein